MQFFGWVLGSRGRVCMVAAAAVALAYGQARADVVYSSKSSFDAASTGVTTIDFTGLAGAMHATGLLGQPLTIGSVSFSSPGPAAVADPQYTYALAPNYADGDYLFANYGSPDTINITLPGSTAVGFNVGGEYGDPSSITITLSDGEIYTLSGTTGNFVTGTATTLDYVGFTSHTPITTVSIVYEPENAQFGAIDNFSFGTALIPTVPEPGSLVLMGSGLMGVVGVWRRRRSE